MFLLDSSIRSHFAPLMIAMLDVRSSCVAPAARNQVILSNHAYNVALRVFTLVEAGLTGGRP